MRYSDDVIEEVIRRTNIVDLIGQDVHLKRAGGSYTGLCPFHAEKTPSFNVSPSKQMYYCFGCHAGGNALTYMMEYHNYTFTEALKILAEKAGVQLPEESLSEEQRAASEKKARLLEIYKSAASFYYFALKRKTDSPPYRYLQGRGLTDETIRRFGLGYADAYGDSLYRYLKKQGMDDALLEESGLFRFDEKQGVSDRFWNRVMFPIMDTRGRVIGFGGRVMGEGKPKYLNSPESWLFNKRKNLYALQYARSTRKNYMILCEGYMDVITLHQAGFTNACASLGTALTEEQCALLRRFTGEVLLLYDSDSAGINAALRAIPLLKNAGITPRVTDLKPYKDPDEFIRAEGAAKLEERLQQSENAFLFEIGQTALSYRRSDPAEWTAFQHETAKKLLSFPEELERQNYLDAVCARYGFSKEAMSRLVSKEAAVMPPPEEKPYSSGIQETRKREKDEKAPLAEKLLLSYLANYPEAYPQIKDLISPEDFTDPFCRRIAAALYQQLENGSVSEAALIAHLPDSGDESKAAALFHTEIRVSSGAELDRAFTDTVAGMLRASNEARLRDADITDMNVYGRYIDNQKKLEQFGRGTILHLTWKDE